MDTRRTLEEWEGIALASTARKFAEDGIPRGVLEPLFRLARDRQFHVLNAIASKDAGEDRGFVATTILMLLGEHEWLKAK